MSEIIGHKNIIDFFENVNNAGTLSHAYCFVGPRSVGKATVTKYLASTLLDVSLGKVENNPDFLFIGREKNEKTDKTKKHIDVDQIRRVRSFFSMRSYGGKKIAIIDDAHLMNASAANALLKTLEEPGRESILFLITTDEKQLPETIVSRSQVFYFTPVRKEILEKYGIKRGMQLSTIDEYLFYSAGLPGRLLQFLEDEECLSWYKAEANRFVELFFCPFFAKLKSVEELFGDKTDHIATRENLQHVLQIWLFVLREWIRIQNGGASFLRAPKESIPPDMFISLEKNIYKAIDELEQNVHPRLLIENILLEIP